MTTTSELDDDDLDDDQQDTKLPKLFMHGDPDPEPLVSWLFEEI